MLRPLPPEYEALGPLGGTELHLHFRGPFQGREVLWNARFLTCARDGTACSRIDIGAEGPAGQPLTVVLDVPCFDAPTVRKTIIMVRQYRRLRLGRHEFGARGPRP